MRFQLLAAAVLLGAIGCDARPSAPSASHPSSSAGEPPAAEAQPPIVAEPVRQNAPLPAPTSGGMTREEIEALVRSMVAAELAKRDAQPPAAAVDEAHLATVARAAAEEAVAKAIASRQHGAQDQAAQAAEARQSDEALLAEFLLLPHELERVAELKQRLRQSTVWGLTRQDLDFASDGLAAPLLHDALHAAAERADPNVPLDVVAREAGLSPPEIVLLARFPPVEREQLARFFDAFGQGRPSPASDRYIRDFVLRYPFIGKMVLSRLKQSEPAERSPAAAQP